MAVTEADLLRGPAAEAAPPIEEPTAPAPAPIPGETPPGEPPEGSPPAEPEAETPEQKRVRDAQRLMHAATQRAAEYKRRLDAIVGDAAARAVPAAPAQVGATEPRPEPAAPGPSQPTGTTPFITDEAVDRLHQAYAAAPDDKTAFKALVVGLANEIRGRMFLDRQFFERAAQVASRHTRAESAREATATGVVQQTEQFWGEVAPHIPSKLLWAFAPEAERTHPGDLQAQALYCLEQAALAMGPAAEGAVEAERQARAQGATLPGGGARPAAPTGGRLPTMVEQMRTTFRGVRE